MDLTRADAYAAVVVAAGLSARMGMFKPLLDVGGRAAALRLLDTIRLVGVGRIVVVTGHKRERLESVIRRDDANRDDAKESSPGGVELVYNPDYQSGMFGSIKTGIRALQGLDGEMKTAALIFLADVPLVSAETISGLLGAFEGRGRQPTALTDESGAARGARRPFALPVYDEKNGHPLLVPREYFDEILLFDGADGLKGVRGKYDAEMIRYVTNDVGCVFDMDTPDDYAKIREYYARRNAEGKR